MVSTTFFVTAAALSAPLVAGHGYMGLPKTTFPKGGDITAPAATISSGQFKAPSGMSFTTDPESNTKAFTAWLKTSDYSSLKDLIVKKSTAGECGNSAVGDPQPLPDAVEWTHGASEGFTASHQGPCEVWCDGQMAFHDDNCAKNFPAAPAKLPYDKSKCAGAKKLATYWLALHSTDWQVYVGCAALSGTGGGGGGSAPAPAPGPGPAPVTPTVRPTTPSNAPPAATPAPAPDSDDCDEYPEPDDDDCDDDLPEPDCDDEYPEPDDDAAGEGDDCDEDLPEPDCDDDLPEPDCDDDLPEPDCDDDLPEPEYGGDADVKIKDINFSTYQRSADDAPGHVYPEDY